MKRFIRSIRLLALVCLVSAPFALPAQEIWLKTEAQGAVMDPRLWTVSGGAIGGSAGIEFIDAIKRGYSLGLDVSYLYLFPVDPVPPRVSLIHYMGSGGYRWNLSAGMGVGYYIDLGLGSSLAALPGSSSLSSSFQFRPGIGMDLQYLLSPTRRLTARLGVFSLIEGSHAWISPDFRFGVSFRFQENKRAQKAAAKARAATQKAARDQVAAREDMKLLNSDASAPAAAPVYEGQRLVIYGSFEANKVTLTPAFGQQYPVILQYLKTIPNLKRLEILGYNSDDGKPDDLLELSTDRAIVVKQLLDFALVGLDVATEAKGMGRSNPIATNATAEGRAQNRRIEIVIHVESQGDPK